MTASAAPGGPRARWFGSLKFRLMLASALVIGASVTTSALMVLQRVERRSEQAVMELERDNAERLASLLTQRVVNLQQMLRATAEVLPPAARTSGDAAAAFIASNPALLAAFGSIFIAAADGQVLAMHDGSAVRRPALNLATREHFRATLDKGVPVVSAPIFGRLSNEPVIQLTMPVAAAAGQPAAVLGGSLRLRSRNLLDDLTYAGGSGDSAITTVVIDAHGTIVSHPQRDRVMRPIDTEPGIAAAVAYWVAQGRPVEPTAFGVRDGGNFVTLAGVPGADWIVFRIAPEGDLMGGLVQARREALQWAGGVALAGGLLILALLAALLDPLSRLRQRALSLQDASLALEGGWPQARGEIGELSEVLQRVLRERALGEQAQHRLVQQLGIVLACAPVGIAITRGGHFELLSSEFCALLGWDQNELAGRDAREIFASEADFQALLPRVAEAYAARGAYLGEWQFRRRDGSSFWGRLQGRPVDPDELAAGTIWLLEDVTEHREARERLSWSATHDQLTRLLNRGAFEDRIAGCLAEGTTPAALLFIDLDRFKDVNDSGGHAAGDAVLRDVATVLQEHVRGGDAAARLGGDEFALLLPGCDADAALALAERLRRTIAQVGVDQGGRRLTVGASIGVVELEPARAIGVADWLALADGACYDAKRCGRDAVRLCPPRAPSSSALVPA